MFCRNICFLNQNIFIFRQLLMCSGVWSLYFVIGLGIGTPTVLVPQLRAEANDTEAVTFEEATWLPVISGYSGLLWVPLLPLITSLFGRRLTIIVISSFTLIGYIVFYFSYNFKLIIVSQVLLGTITFSHLAVLVIIITEYTSAEYRGVFLTLKSATLFWGILAANTIGTFFHWKVITVVGIICVIYSLIIVYFNPESPLWLAKKGRFDDCAKSHLWLKGSDETSKKELDEIITRNQKTLKPISLKFELSNIVKKEFYKPILLSLMLQASYIFSGKMVCIVYSVEILKNITMDTSTAYTSMLILDAITVFTMYVACAFAKIFNRRPMLITSLIITILFLFLLSIYLYLAKLTVISENKYISISLLAGYSIAVGCGPMILCTSIIGELVPLESRGFSLCIIAASFKIINLTLIKVIPYFFGYIGMHGMFCFFGVSSLLMLVLIYKYLPETKDKTLVEIHESMKNKIETTIL